MDYPCTLAPVWIAVFVGHRPKAEVGRSREELAACRPRIQRALVDLQRRAAIHGGTVELLSGVAAGADQGAVQAAKDLGIPVHVIVPLPVALFANDFGGDDDPDWKCAIRMIDDARAGKDGATFRVAEAEIERPACYHEASRQMLEVADVLVAVWNGVDSESVGGTSEAVRDARTRGIPTVIIHSARKDEPEIPSALEAWPDSRDRMFEIRDELARLSGSALRPRGAGCNEGPVQVLLSMLDTTAVAAADHFRTRLIRSLYLHFAAALLAAATAAFTPVLYRLARDEHGSRTADLLHSLPIAMTVVEFALVLVAFLAMHQAARRHSHDQWSRNRFAAELVRGAVLTAGLSDPLRPLIAKHDREWQRFAIAAGLLASRNSPAMELDQRLAAYISGRIKDQERYFQTMGTPAVAWQQVLGWIARLAAFFAPICIGLAVVAKCFPGADVTTDPALATLAAFLPIAIPLIAGAANSLLVAMDAGRRAGRYRAMHRRLTELGQLALGVKTIGGLRRLANDTESLLLNERVEWYGAANRIGH